ncbi:MAG TPA: hypothetical protein VGK87_04360 [Anaerolineae bacterium]
MFLNSDLIQRQAHGYNEQLENLFVPVPQVAERSAAQRLADGLRSVFGMKPATRRVSTTSAFMGHGVSAK